MPDYLPYDTLPPGFHGRNGDAQTMPIDVRPAVPDDADLLARLCAGIQGLHVEMHPELFRAPAHQELAAFFRERLADADYTAFLAWDGAEAIGYVVVHFIRRPENAFVQERA